MEESQYPALQFATPQLSIVIPAYNEANRIGPTLDSISAYLKREGIYAEVIVVDDGSTDDTALVVELRHDQFVSLRLLRCERNSGKGRAVRLGMLVARGKMRLFMDADNSADIAQLDRLNDAAASQSTLPEVVIGSIAVTGSDLASGRSGVRSALARVGNRVVQRAVLPGIHDTQRGFKIFTADAADAIFSRCQIDGWGFDIEVLVIARALGFTVLEVPVEWRHHDQSRVGPTAYLTTLVDVARVRRRIRAGKPLERVGTS